MKNDTAHNFSCILYLSVKRQRVYVHFLAVFIHLLSGLHNISVDIHLTPIISVAQ